MTVADEISVMIDDCEKRAEKLSDWECQFIDSVSTQVGRGRSLTDKQIETLQNIWERVT